MGHDLPHHTSEVADLLQKHLGVECWLRCHLVWSYLIMTWFSCFVLAYLCNIRVHDGMHLAVCFAVHLLALFSFRTTGSMRVLRALLKSSPQFVRTLAAYSCLVVRTICCTQPNHAVCVHVSCLHCLSESATHAFVVWRELSGLSLLNTTAPQVGVSY